MVSHWVCKECGSDRIGAASTLTDTIQLAAALGISFWDAWVDEDVTCSFDYHKCLECAAEMRIERREEAA